MTKKEYKQKLENYEAFEALTPEETSKLYHSHKERTQEDGEQPLAGCNFRATYRRDASGALILKSYVTDVCEIADGDFIKLWEGFSATTLKHINAFRARFGFEKLSKREWVEMKLGF